MKLALNLRHQIKQNGCNEPVVVFLDRLCLQDGEDWECGFLNGLNHSSLVVLLISKNTFLGIQEADKRQDNVLLEYEYALRMVILSRIADYLFQYIIYSINLLVLLFAHIRLRRSRSCCYL